MHLSVQRMHMCQSWCRYISRINARDKVPDESEVMSKLLEYFGTGVLLRGAPHY